MLLHLPEKRREGVSFAAFPCADEANEAKSASVHRSDAVSTAEHRYIQTFKQRPVRVDSDSGRALFVRYAVFSWVLSIPRGGPESRRHSSLGDGPGVFRPLSSFPAQTVTICAEKLPVSFGQLPVRAQEILFILG